jgi:copper chaperone
MQHASSGTASTVRPVTLAVSGMSCGHCVTAVTEALSRLPGVTVTRVAVGAAAVTLDSSAASVEGVVEAIREAGYEARVAAQPLPQAAGTSCCSPPSA